MSTPPDPLQLLTDEERVFLASVWGCYSPRCFAIIRKLLARVQQLEAVREAAERIDWNAGRCDKLQAALAAAKERKLSWQR